MKRIAMAIAIVLLAAAGPALGFSGGSSGPTGPKKTNDYAQAKRHVDAKRYAQAIPLLQKVVKANPTHANAWNLLAYSNRKTGKLQLALGQYIKALDIDPNHKDAHEYLGELYLKLGDLGKAVFHLKRLDSICTFGCEQYDELKQEIAAYKKLKGLS
jgi:tetratricopeptide (TPR) repeat protein|tara:strand:+ start:478 stop:948 length:471 start_codon:yes stop_codon:yes gene_type:complete